ncbi:hypothetical protein C7S18_22110 [Ahniella affigens]|uniref:Lipoprotein n=1 Tax=Ahniella affigens TaxID=2021234 RepID=A0A2P1PXY8_9GAMM|nr:hypothetical protein [Ahniella affigens]AVP99702.1 hypothetical protein C7S18_22110 [Ahniella affigens]
MNKQFQKKLLWGALTLALTACGGQNVKSDVPEAESAPVAAAAPAEAESQAATPAPAPVVRDSLASSTFPDGDPVPPGPKGHTTAEIKLKTPHEPSSDLKERALERWALLIANRGADAFQYLTPGYRSNKNAEQYGAEMGARPVRWKEIGVNSVTCEDDDSCEVSLWSESQVKLSVAMGSNSVFGGHLEKWLKIDGVWYYLPNY